MLTARVPSQPKPMPTHGAIDDQICSSVSRLFGLKLIRAQDWVPRRGQNDRSGTTTLPTATAIAAVTTATTTTVTTPVACQPEKRSCRRVSSNDVDNGNRSDDSDKLPIYQPTTLVPTHRPKNNSTMRMKTTSRARTTTTTTWETSTCQPTTPMPTDQQQHPRR